MADGMLCSTSISAAGSASPIATTTPRLPIPHLSGGDVAPAFRPARPAAVFEIGRMIAGNAGILVTKVLYVKHGEGRTFVIVTGR